MKKLISILLTLLLAAGFWSCKDNSSGSGTDFEEAPAEKQFIWNAMNYWYYWQEDVPQLADGHTYFEDEEDFHTYLRNTSTAETLFNNLLFSKENFGENIGEDDFSFFIDDYVAFLQSRQGISQNFGFEYGIVRFCQECSELFGYVQYVLEGTPADNAGITRGDIFTGINGTELTVNNYRSLLSNSTYELTMAESVNGEISETDETVTINSTQIVEDPIYLSKVMNAGSSKVGYLLYNSFQTNSHQNLNDEFGNFASEGIDELVLDLRYNGGGSVITSAILASMISGLDESEEYAVYTHNSKRSDRNDTVTFLNVVPILDENFIQIDEIPMNTLSIDRLFVLTGFGTASASEAVINGLRPFMDVILIGRQTVGKDDASLTLYDAPAPYTDRNQTNPDHQMAIQPIVLKVKNAIGESNGEGFIPEHPLNELSFLDELPPLGDENDPLLAKALELISGQPVAKALAEPSLFRGEMFKDSRDLEQFGKEMYVLPQK